MQFKQANILIPLRALVVLGGFVATYYVAQTVVIRRAATAQIRVAPFVLELETVSGELSPQPGKVLERRLVARRADGSTAIEGAVKPGESMGTIRRITFIDGRLLVLVDSLGLKSTRIERNQAHVAALKSSMLSPQSDCREEGAEFLRFETVLGQKVAVLRLASARWITTRWAAVDLACQPLRVRVEEPQDGGLLMLRAETQAVRLSLIDPPASLFNVGETYKETRPSEVQQAILGRAGRPASDQTKSEGKKADQAFLE